MILHFNKFWFSFCFFAVKSFVLCIFLLGLTFGQGSIKTKIEVDFLENESKYKTEVLKNVVDKKPRKNSTGVISVWIGLEGKKPKPNRTEINRFEPVFGSVRFQNLKKKKKPVWLFILVQNWTEPKMLSPNT